MKTYDICRRAAALLTVFALLTGVLSGCGREEEIPQVTLRTMSIMGDDGEKEAYTALLESYSEQYPHVYHMGTVAQTANAYKLNAVFEDTYTASKYPHAVYYYTDTGMEELTEYFVSVEEIRQTYPDFASGISEAAMKDVRAEDGKTYCVPFAGNWTAVAVNPSLLERFSLTVPQDWQELITVSGVLSARGITPFANSPDDCAPLLEMLCVSMGGEDAVESILDSDSPLEEPEFRQVWLEVFRAYQELCGIHSFPEASVTDQIAQAEQMLRPVSAGDAGQDDYFPDNNTEQTVKDDALEVFNSGGAAMIILDSSRFGEITLEGYRLVMFPECPNGGRRLMTGGFSAGWFITRRAFSDKSVCDAVVAFVDHMTGSAAAESFSRLGYLSSADIQPLEGDNGLCQLADTADGFARSRITSANSTRFSELEHIAAALSMGLITPEQAVEMAADPSLKLTDVIQIPEPEVPETAVSGSDAVISGSDL